MSDELAKVQAEIEAARKAQAEAEARLAELQASQQRVKIDTPPLPADDAAPDEAPPVAERFEEAPQSAPAPADLDQPVEPGAHLEPAPSTGPLAADEVGAIRAGYAFEGAALEMGALVNGEADPETQVRIPLGMVNRHGLIAGATGTGKTKTLQVLAEQLSAAGVPVFAADIKGDLSGVATPGESSDKLLARTAGIGQAWDGAGFPVEYFALGGEGIGVPIRATVLSFGPVLLSKVLGLNDTQESSLGIVFAYADEQRLPLVDLKDLRELLLWLTSDLGKEELKRLGGISTQTAGVILREITAFSEQGADVFFGEPEIDTRELMRTTPDGRGVISLLEVPGVASQPALFSTFLMWLLADLFEDLPEVGDIDKPKLVFFFDEAHLLFKDASKDFLSAITQTVRLIRSKGVGIFFVTQTPKDVPSDVLAQLGSRVQHQLRAHTPDDATALRSTVRTYPRSGYDLEQVLTGLGIGEAIVTVMNERGAPTPVAWTRLRAPQGSMDPTPEAAMRQTVQSSSLLPKYGQAVDRESAYEILQAKLRAAQKAEQDEAAREEAEAEAARLEKAARQGRGSGGSGGSGQRSGGNVVTDFIGSRTGQSLIREIVRGVFGNRRR
ncbi:helicase HerA-like domain-containing protein [Agrococcus beijingensis]|uniref:helicase HerA-like domain-containing protein n=1 Tax=Agrococcus beijingensis TaxID=3068634 RepID=UPI0027404795|nr:helicase HerA-like domain-containing protein [Agrococcus sp. REN33]